MFNAVDVTDAMVVILTITFFFLSLYNVFFLIKNPLYYIYSKSNKRIPAKTLGILFGVCFAVVIASLLLILSFFIFNAINAIYYYLNLSEIPISIVFLIFVFIYIITDISFLKLLKLLFLKPTGMITRKERDL
jgi:hypothetical protein